MTATKAKTPVTKQKVSQSVPAIDSLPANPFVFEVLNLISKQRTNIKKVEVLQRYEDPSLKSILIWNFDESVISLLPEGDVPYADTNDQTVYSGSLSDNLKREAAGG